MRLTLSSAAAPDLALPELLEACARRGFDGVELVSGHAHGVGSGVDPSELERLRRVLAASGVRLSGLYLLPEHAAEAPELARIASALDAPLVAPADLAAGVGDDLVSAAWQIDPHHPDAGAAAELLGGAHGPRYVRLLGGGPETARQEGLGIGALLARLALARFSGPLVLAPSDPVYHYAWRAWLGRAGGWGCGSKAGGSSIYSLQLT